MTDKKEFNLSDKIQEDVIGYNREDAITTKDVKEFIRLLKAHFVDYEEGVNYWIDKLAGDKLTK